MSKNLFGTVVVDRQIAGDDLWLCEPFSRGQAWLDLTLLANDEPRTVMVRGGAGRLEKGQVGCSVLNLADRWQWSREKARSFLDDLRDRRKITYKMDNVATVITVLDYSVFNREKIHNEKPEPTADQTAEPSAEPTQNIGTIEQGNKNIGTGEDAPALKNAVSLEKALERFTGSDSGYSEAEIKAAWHELTAGAVDGNWVIGRPLRPVADWRSALESELWKRRQIFGETNAGGSGATTGLSANVVAIQTSSRVRELEGKICELEDEIHQDRVSNLPRDPIQMQKLKELRAELKAARPSKEDGKP